MLKGKKICLLPERMKYFVSKLCDFGFNSYPILMLYLAYIALNSVFLIAY